MQQDLLKKVIAKYSSCKSYKDAGTAIDASSDNGSQMIFSTNFSRPDYFLFEWEDVEHRIMSVVEYDGYSVRTKLPIHKGWKEERDLSWALSITGGSAMGVGGFIAELLMPDIVGPSKLLELYPFTYDDSSSGSISIVTSDRSNHEHLEQLHINVDEVTVLERTRKLALCVSKEDPPRSARFQSVYRTQYKSVEFDF